MDPGRKWLLVGTALVLAIIQSGCATVEREPAPKVNTRDQTVQLQIFLDSQHFGPGTIDGRRGEFTSKALELYCEAYGLPPGSLPEVSGIQPFTTYTITEENRSALGAMASEPADLALQKRLPYVTLGELLGERFHTKEAFLQDLNPAVDLNRAPAGTVLVVPNVDRPFDSTRFPSRYSAAPASVKETRSVLVDTRERMLHVHEAGRLIAAFPITPGSETNPAPPGNWKIVRAVPWPWYRYDKGVLERGERTTEFFNLPPGPNSPVGILWAGLNRQSIGIHGTNSPETIGRAGSAGCIRLANWDAATFYTYVGNGVPVTIR